MSDYMKARLVELQKCPEALATFFQRKAIFNMRQALGRSVAGIKDLSFQQASVEIERLKAAIREDGFAPREESTDNHQPDFDGRRF